MTKTRRVRFSRKRRRGGRKTVKRRGGRRRSRVKRRGGRRKSRVKRSRRGGGCNHTPGASCGSRIGALCNTGACTGNMKSYQNLKCTRGLFGNTCH